MIRISIIITLLLSLNSCDSNLHCGNTSFPEDWVGEWTGQLHLSNKSFEETPMKLSIAPTSHKDTLLWQIKYGEQDARDYRLIKKSVDQYILDEQNSILIDFKLFGNTMVSYFSVMNNSLMVKYTLQYPNDMNYEVVVFDQSPVVSGGKKIGNDTIPIVKSFIPKSYQSAYLTKKSG